MKIMKRMFLMLSFASMFSAYQFDAISADRRVVSRTVKKVSLNNLLHGDKSTLNVKKDCTSNEIYCAPGKYFSGKKSINLSKGSYSLPGNSTNVVIQLKCNTECPAGYYCPGGCFDIGPNAGRKTCSAGQYQNESGKSSCKSKEYNVTYKCGNGSSGPAPTTHISATYGQYFTPAENTCNVPKGKKFGGWRVSETKDDIKSAKQPFMWTYTESKTFTANWIDEDVVQYEITYICDGVTSSDKQSVEKYTVTLGEVITIKDISGWCEHDGFKFDGWKSDHNLQTESGKGTPKYTVDTEITYTYAGNAKLTATWTQQQNPPAGKTYTVTYRTGNCSQSDEDVHKDTNASNAGVYTVPDYAEEKINQIINEENKFTFKGWNTSLGQITENFPNGWVPDKDITVYAACEGKENPGLTTGGGDVPTYHCSVGQYLPANGNQCRDCEKGYKCPDTEQTYSKQNHDQGLTRCSGNTFTNLPGQTECQFCNGTLEVFNGANVGCDSTDPEGCNVKYTCYGGNVLTTQAVSTNSFTITTAVCPYIFDGQTFKGWKAPNGDVVVANDSYTCTNSDIEFTAEYNQSSAGGCIVTYDCNNIGSNQGIVEPSGTGTFSVKGENVCSNIPDNKELAYWEPSDNVNAKISGGTTYSCGNQTSLTFTAHWRNKTTNPTFVEGVSVTCGAGYWLYQGESVCSPCEQGYFCPGGTYETNSVRNRGIYPCLNNGVTNDAGTGCTVKFDTNDLLYGISGDANCWLEKDEADYKNCVFGGAKKR